MANGGEGIPFPIDIPVSLGDIFGPESSLLNRVLSRSSVTVRRDIANAQTPYVPLKIVNFSADKAGKALATLVQAAQAKITAQLSAEEAQSLAVLHAMAIAVRQWGGRMPVVPDTAQIDKAARASGVAVDPRSTGFIVLSPSSWFPDDADETTKDVIRIGRQSIRTIKAAGKVGRPAGPIVSSGDISSGPPVVVSPPEQLEQGVTLAANPVIVAGAVVLSVAIVTGGACLVADHYIDAEASKAIAVTNAVLAAELERQRITSVTGVDPGIGTGVQALADRMKNEKGLDVTGTIKDIAIAGVVTLGLLGAAYVATRFALDARQMRAA